MLEKIRRLLESFLPVQANRRGECTPEACGAACCKLPIRCLFLSGREKCRVYVIRPLQCRKFPRCEKDLAVVHDCGFRWDAP
ncbi:MAG: hypothetical protein V1921_01280 [Candidatus Altiarchaeota archaeon]